MKQNLDFGITCMLLLAVACACFLGLQKAYHVSAETTADTFTIVIDPGHGGNDPGKVGVKGTLEKEINLEIAVKLGTALYEQGYNVAYTRTEDAGLYQESDTNKKAADLRARCELITKESADLVISIHQNSFTDEDVCGAQVFYYKHSTEGKLLAGLIQQKLAEIDPDNDRIIKANDDYYMLIHTPCPTVIVECGFLSNPEEEARLGSEEYQDLLVQAITAGVTQYVNGNDHTENNGQ